MSREKVYVPAACGFAMRKQRGLVIVVLKEKVGRLMRMWTEPFTWPTGVKPGVLSDWCEQRYTRPGGAAVQLGQPFCSAGPGLRLRWRGGGAGRTLLNDLLSHLFILELDELAVAAAAGQDYEVAPLRELAERPGWVLQSQLGAAPERYRLTRTDNGHAAEGLRLELLLTLELATRVALESVDGESKPPSWVARAWRAHAALRQALRGRALFQLE